MGSSQSKSKGGRIAPHPSSSPHLHSPRYSSIGGRLNFDSPKFGSHGSLNGLLRSHGSQNRLHSPRAVHERTPLVVVKPSPRLLAAQPDDAMTPPPLALWIGPALACALAYALYNIFIKKGSASINPILGGVILQFVAAICGCLLLACVVYQNSLYKDDDVDGVLPEKDSLDGDMQFLMWDWVGVRWAILAGVAVGAAEMISFTVSGMGVQAMQSIPIIIGGSVMFGTVLGFLALGETLTIRGWSGVLMICIGISLVGMDDLGDD